MLTFVQRTCWVALLASVGCSFEGSEGQPGEPRDEDFIEEEEEEGTLPPPVEIPVPIPGAPPACDGFTEVGDSYYLVSTATFDWAGARDHCATYPGAYLATFEAAATSAELAAALTLPPTAWTAVEQKVGRRTRVYEGWGNTLLDKRTALPPSFPWANNEPNDGNGWYIEDNAENVAVVRADGKFDDNNRFRLHPALCECVPAPE